MDPTIDGADLETTIGAIVGILFLLSQAGSRIAQLIPGKKDDEFMGKIERIMRKVVDFTAGNHGEPGDPTAIKPKG